MAAQIELTLNSAKHEAAERKAVQAAAFLKAFAEKSHVPDTPKLRLNIGPNGAASNPVAPAAAAPASTKAAAAPASTKAAAAAPASTKAAAATVKSGGVNKKDSCEKILFSTSDPDSPYKWRDQKKRAGLTLAQIKARRSYEARRLSW